MLISVSHYTDYGRNGLIRENKPQTWLVDVALDPGDALISATVNLLCLDC